MGAADRPRRKIALGAARKFTGMLLRLRVRARSKALDGNVDLTFGLGFAAQRVCSLVCSGAGMFLSIEPGLRILSERNSAITTGRLGRAERRYRCGVIGEGPRFDAS